MLQALQQKFWVLMPEPKPLKDGDECFRPHVAFVLGPFLLRKLTFGRFGGQMFDTPLQLMTRPKIQVGVGFVRQNDLQSEANTPVERSTFWCRNHNRTLSNNTPSRRRNKPPHGYARLIPPHGNESVTVAVPLQSEGKGSGHSPDQRSRPPSRHSAQE
jgi:hypothetical protein